MVAKEQKPSAQEVLKRGPKPKFHRKVKTLSPAELEQREMEEYE